MLLGFKRLIKGDRNTKFINKIVEFLKKIGLLKVEASKGKYTSSKDEAYKPSDPQDN